MGSFLDTSRNTYESVTTLKESSIKIGATVIRHTGYLTFQMAEVAIPDKIFQAILRHLGAESGRC